jgi:hypothetical protein
MEMLAWSTHLKVQWPTQLSWQRGFKPSTNKVLFLTTIYVGSSETDYEQGFRLIHQIDIYVDLSVTEEHL